MPIYRIADINIKAEPVFDYAKTLLKPFACASEEFDFEAVFDKTDIIARAKSRGEGQSLGFCESSMLIDAVYKMILKSFGGFFFHSSCLALDGNACAFTAPSGTGKSTHAAMWRRLFGERVVMINDDKPIIRKKDGIYRAYGTPWMGKSSLGCNTSAPVKAVFVLRRGSENRVHRAKPASVVKELLEAVMIDSNRRAVVNMLELINDFTRCVPVFELYCKPELQAAKIAYEAFCSVK